MTTEGSATARYRSLYHALERHHANTPNGRDYERRADFEAAYDAHEAAAAVIEADMAALEDAARDEARARLGGTR